MFKIRVRLFFFLMFLIFTALEARLFQMQVVRGGYYASLAKGNNVWLEAIAAPRGRILDRNGLVLADDKPAFHLWVDAAKLPLKRCAAPGAIAEFRRIRNEAKRDEARSKLFTLLEQEAPRLVSEPFVQDLSKMLGRPVENTAKRLHRAMRFAISDWAPEVSFLDVGYENLIRIETHPQDFPGFRIEAGSVRVYPQGRAAAHALGYLGAIGEEEIRTILEAGRLPGLMELSPDEFGVLSSLRLWSGQLIGKSGVEYTLNDTLRGRTGQRLMERVLGDEGPLVNIKPTDPQDKPVVGKDLQLTLDIRVQKLVENALKDEVGAAVVLNPATGEILALVSKPDFDPNDLTPPVDPDTYEAIAENNRLPLLNRAVQSAYPPGSTIKPFLSAIALTEGAATPSTTYECYGELYPGEKRKFNPKCFRGPDKGGHGAIDMTGAIRESCNVYFYKLGQKIGIANIIKWETILGFGRTTGLELPGEKSGFLPTPQWKKKHLKESWYPGDTCQVSIGQGMLLATPLQMAAATAVIANGGLLVTPHMVKNLPQENAAPGRAGFKSESLTAVRHGMWEVVNAQHGTGFRTVRVNGLEVCGKTGSAETGKAGQRIARNPPWYALERSKSGKLRIDECHAWFVGYAPANKPEIAFAIVVEFAGHGGSVAGPVAHSIVEGYFNLPPSEGGGSESDGNDW